MKKRASVATRAFFMKVFIGMAKEFGYSSPTDLLRDVKACWGKV